MYETQVESLTLLTVDEVAALLKVRPRWVRDEVRAGRFPVTRVGRQLRFRPAQIQAYLEGR